jgi:ankyrin repeat protein
LENCYIPLYIAAFNGHAIVVRLLLDHGAAINREEQYGGIVLLQAIKGNHYAVVLVLLEHGANASLNS